MSQGKGRGEAHVVECWGPSRRPGVSLVGGGGSRRRHRGVCVVCDESYRI